MRHSFANDNESIAIPEQRTRHTTYIPGFHIQAVSISHSVSAAPLRPLSSFYVFFFLFFVFLFDMAFTLVLLFAW